MQQTNSRASKAAASYVMCGPGLLTILGASVLLVSARGSGGVGIRNKRGMAYPAAGRHAAKPAAALAGRRRGLSSRSAGACPAILTAVAPSGAVCGDRAASGRPEATTGTARCGRSERVALQFAQSALRVMTIPHFRGSVGYLRAGAQG